MWTHGQTDIKKLLVAFHNFAKASKQASVNVVQHNTNFSISGSLVKTEFLPNKWQSEILWNTK